MMTTNTTAPKKSKRSRSKKFENLVGPTDPKIDYLARERLVTARIGLLLRHSFFAFVIFSLPLCQTHVNFYKTFFVELYC